MKTLKLCPQLTKDYISFYENEKTSADVIIRVGKEENVKDFHAHSFVLAVRSQYFRNLSFDENNFKETFGLLLISKEFEIIELLELLEDQLLNSPNQIHQNFSTTLQLSLESFNKLYEFCLKTIQERPEIIFKSKDFHLLNEDTLFTLLQNQGLTIKEVEKWESIIKWGIHHSFTTPTIDYNTRIPDVTLWTKDKFRDLAKTLQKFIPLIDFHKIEPENFYEEVKPFKKIIDKSLYDEILKYYIVSSKKSNVDNPKPEVPTSNVHIRLSSVLIELDCFQLLINWINETIPGTSLNRYKLTLLLKGSANGFTANTFHGMCDNRGATLTVIKIRGSTEIIGGYNPASWNQSLYINEPLSIIRESFVFKLNQKDIRQSIVGRPVADAVYTIENHPNNGPCFYGALYIKGGSHGDFKRDMLCYCDGANYGVQLRKTNSTFSVDDYEVYQVIKE
ncbi:6391_t:CDS:2 [Funneliformis caledonium]|uniref:6391_t:CDS:1 n=1 Tax=Funneliformis caledonium TaxID=1117310 RepID=A0A9N8ZS10_9GLOM|nr:6391_t:CDS:2 [Funneliformis caledonium]